MNRFACSLVMVGAIVAWALPAVAQQKRISPHEVISQVISNDRIMIVYGRPYTKSPRTGEVRKIWGGLVPFGQNLAHWRTEASLITTEVPIVMGGMTIPAGADRSGPSPTPTARLS